MKMYRVNPQLGRQPVPSPKAASDPPGAGFWPWHEAVRISSYALAHPQLDMQEWFEEQVSQRPVYLAEQVLINAQR